MRLLGRLPIGGKPCSDPVQSFREATAGTPPNGTLLTSAAGNHGPGAGPTKKEPMAPSNRNGVFFERTLESGDCDIPNLVAEPGGVRKMPTQLGWIAEDMPDPFEPQVKAQKSEDDIKSWVLSGKISKEQAQRMNIATTIKRDQTAETEVSDRAHMARREWGKSTSAILTEVLDGPWKASRASMLHQLGIYKFLNALAQERFRRSSSSFTQPFPRLNLLVSSPYFELLVGAVMCVNGVTIGVQVSSNEEQDPPYIEVIEHFFTAFFLVEVALRLSVCGWIWICSPGNLVDVILIFVSGVLPMWILKPIGVDVANIRVVQTLRTLRLMRLIRTAREKRVFRTPFKLIKGLIDSCRMILHVYVVIGAATYIFAVYGVYFIGKVGAFQAGSPYASSDKAWPAARDLALETFATVPRSTFTVFQVTTLDNWASIARPLMKYTIGVPCIFTTIIMVNSIVLQNLITAVIVSNALKCAEEDEEMIAIEKREASETELEDLRRVFMDLKPPEGEDILTADEFQSAVATSSSLRNKLQLVNCPIEESEEVWELFAEEDERGVCMARFADIMQKLGKGAKAKDSYSVAQHTRRLNSRIERLRHRLTEQKRKVDELRTVTKAVSKELGVMLHEATEFIRLVGVCVPGQPVTRDVSQLATRLALPWTSELEAS